MFRPRMTVAVCKVQGRMACAHLLRGAMPPPASPLMLAHSGSLSRLSTSSSTFVWPNGNTAERKRNNMVILGSGWAAVGVIQKLSKETLSKYNILICSPLNHFVNTPLLPSVTVGTVGPRTIAEPIRNMLIKHRARCPDSFIKFMELEAIGVDTKEKTVTLASRSYDGTMNVDPKEMDAMDSAHYREEVNAKYDMLVCAVGATTNTFGTPGAYEYCTFLKTVQDAMKIRAALLNCFETAAIRTISEKERDRLLTFVIIGAGPTGVEVAAEIRDFAHNDVMPRYSGFKDKKIKVQIVEMSDRLLGTYDKLIQAYTAKQFLDNDIEVFTGHKVVKVNPQSIDALCLKTKETVNLPFGMCVWASGVQPNKISFDIMKQLQPTAGMLEVDTNLRVIGAEGSIFALGDCAKMMDGTMKQSAADLWAAADLNGDGSLTLEEFELMIEDARKHFPQLEAYLGEACKESLFKRVDVDGDEYLKQQEFEEALMAVDRNLKFLPPTAQVAAQQGEYLAMILNTVEYEQLNHKEGFEPAFNYSHQGSMAYVGGDQAVIDSPIFGVSSGLLTYMMWKGVYWGKSVSMTMKVNMAFDWLKVHLLGRDISRL